MRAVWRGRRRAGSALWGLSLLTAVGCGAADRSPAPDLTRALTMRQAMLGDDAAEEAAEEQAPSVQPTGWATLRGRFLLQGEPPAPTKLPVTGSDAEICAPGGKSVFSEELAVGPSGGVKNVVIFLATELPDAAEPWVHPEAAPGRPGEVEFDQKECVFLSHVAALQTGQTLKILNSDPIGHNTKIEGTSLNQIVSGGGFITFTPQEEVKAPLPVSCSIHPWMSAHLLVRDNGYFAVTDEDGFFEISNLPAGVELEFRIWQEKAKFLGGIELDGQVVQRGRYVTTLESGTKEVEVTLDAAMFR